jgi:hypothetical protein
MVACFPEDEVLLFPSRHEKFESMSGNKDKTRNKSVKFLDQKQTRKEKQVRRSRILKVPET